MPFFRFHQDTSLKAHTHFQPMTTLVLWVTVSL